MLRTEYLIIGGGMAADSAVRWIRQHDAAGAIALMDADRHPPYNRPPQVDRPQVRVLTAGL